MKKNPILKSLLYMLALAIMFAAGAKTANAHCQIPCGIYDHHARVAMMLEDVGTIEKSVKNIIALSGKTDPASRNQLVRWVNNKELHAQKIQDTISAYFLAQVVKPADPEDKKEYEKYLQKLADHHAVIVAAMITKQNANLEKVEELRKAVMKLESYYKE